MSLSGLLQLGASTLIFLAAGILAKSWALQPGALKMIGALALYTLGNLIMMRLIRDVGMGVAFSLSGVFQIVAVNVVAFAVFGEKITVVQGAGIGLAIVAIALITLGPQFSGR